MNQDHWSAAERKAAHRAYEAALERERAAVLATFKAKAAAAVTAGDMWDIESYLTHKRREIDSKYDFRYSQLIMVFARLMREGWLREDDLVGISEAKLSAILPSLPGD